LNLTALTLDLMHFFDNILFHIAHSFLSNTQIKLHSNFTTLCHIFQAKT
jgi:hypothetical protein